MVGDPFFVRTVTQLGEVEKKLRKNKSETKIELGKQADTHLSEQDHQR